MKCSVCKENIETTFLNKMLGAYVKDEKGRKHAVCSKCQKLLGEKKNILEKI